MYSCRYFSNYLRSVERGLQKHIYFYLKDQFEVVYKMLIACSDRSFLFSVFIFACQLLLNGGLNKNKGTFKKLVFWDLYPNKQCKASWDVVLCMRE